LTGHIPSSPTGAKSAIAPDLGSAYIPDYPDPNPETLPEEGIDLWGVAVVLARHWRMISAATFGSLVLGIAVSLVLRPTFTATAIILPPQQALSSASMLGQLGSIVGAAGLGGSLGLKTPADMYIGILESRTVADRVISSCHLKEEYKTKTLVDTRVALQKHAHFETGKDSLIHLSVKDPDPRQASAIANSFLDQLYDLNAELVTSEASQRRSFYERRLAEEKTALNDAELAMRDTQQKTGLIQLSGQAAMIINAIAQARAQLVSREVELQSMQTFATDENPETVRIREEIAALKANLEKLQNSQKALQPGDIQLPAGQVPNASLLYERQVRELKYHEALFELLSRQSEAARLDEAKSAPILQVVDRAIPPDKKSGPSRKLITAGFAAFGFIASCLWALGAAALSRMKNDPAGAQKLRDLQSALRG
jgi:uncharacterized protein involved in exopolysaccharide biosynthesis